MHTAFGNIPWLKLVVPEMFDRELYWNVQCYTFTRKIKKSKLHQHISVLFFYHRIAIPHSLLSTKVNLQEGYGKNNSAQTDVHWSGTTQCGWMKWYGGREEVVGGGCSGKGEESRYPGCIHPSFNRQTLTTLQESMNILYHLTCMKWFLHGQKKRTVFLVFCWLHKCLATVLVEIVLYFPCALAPFHIFENSTCCVCEAKSSLVVKCGVMA